MYILYLNHEDVILAILCMGLPITITIAGQWLNSLKFHYNTKCITANGEMMIYVGVNYIIISHDNYWFYATNLGYTKSFLIYAYGFG